MGIAMAVRVYDAAPAVAIPVKSGLAPDESLGVRKAVPVH